MDYLVNGRKSVQNADNWHQYIKLLGKKIETRHYEYSTLYPYPDKITNLILLSVLCSFSAFISLQSLANCHISIDAQLMVIWFHHHCCIVIVVVVVVYVVFSVSSMSSLLLDVWCGLNFLWLFTVVCA